jgi:cell division transport system ATP-binding protein
MEYEQIKSTDNMIHIKSLDMIYARGSYALADITLQIQKGEFIFLTGPSGAGKTTLLKLILREAYPTSGEIIVNGKNVPKIPDNKIYLYRREIGAIFQDYKLLQRKTVLENVSFVLKVLGRTRRERNRRTLDVLRKVGIQHKIHSFPQSLSGGEQQRVSIARALVNNPSLLLADEPTGNLDPDLAVEIMKLFLDINMTGTTVIVATHDRELIHRFGRRVIALDRGKIVPWTYKERIFTFGSGKEKNEV